MEEFFMFDFPFVSERIFENYMFDKSARIDIQFTDHVTGEHREIIDVDYVDITDQIEEQKLIENIQ